MRNKLIAIALVIIGPVMAFFGYQEKKESDAVHADGITVAAEITGGSERSGRRGRKSFEFDVSYATQTGTVVSRTFSVPRKFYELHVQDNTLVNTNAEVRYLAADPQVAILIGGEDNPMIVVYVGAGMFVLGAILAVVFFRKKAAPEPAATPAPAS